MSGAAGRRRARGGPPPARPGGRRPPMRRRWAAAAGRRSRPRTPRTSAPSAAWLAGCGPSCRWIVLVVALAIVSVAFAVLGPKILGNAHEHHLRRASIGKQLPAGVTQEQAVAALQRARPDPAGPDARRHEPSPRRRRRLRRPAAAILLGVAVLYLLSARSSAGCRPTSWPASRSGPSTACAATSTRSSARLPLKYFDGHPRGDILSRVTNDIDNIANSLQQSLTQLITSVLHDHRRAR